MDRQEIKDLIPHREPMLLLDEVWMTGEKTASGRYTVRGDEFFLQGHFPGNPIVPGVILCEVMAQTACILMQDHIEGKLTLYTGIRNVRFKRQVKPGDTIDIDVELTKVSLPFCFVKGEGRVGDEVCVTGDFSVALVDPEVAEQEDGVAAQSM